MPIERICKVCSRQFHVYPSRLRRPGIQGVYCSKTCKGVDMKRGTERVCPTCQKQFYVPICRTKMGYGNYCSKRCWAATNVIGKEYPCVFCGVAVFRSPWLQRRWGTQCFCSADCMHKSKRMLGHGVWETKFRGWMRKAWIGTECNACGSQVLLELDHIVPRMGGGLPTQDNAQTLCRSCNRRKRLEDLPYYLWLKKHSALSGRV
jgi:hypothetical protein